MSQDIASLIHMNAGEPSLAAGVSTIMPEGPTVPTNADQLKSHMGLAPAAPAAPVQSVATQQPIPQPHTQLAPQPKLTPGLVVTSTGNTVQPGAVVKTEAIASLFKSVGQPQSVGQAQSTASTFTSVPIQASQPVQQATQIDDEWIPVEDDWGTTSDTTQDIEDELVTHTAPAPQAIAPPTPSPVAAPAPVSIKADNLERAIAATTPKPANVTGTSQRFAGDDELDRTEATMNQITEQCRKALFDMGCTLLNDQAAIDQTSAIHKAIYSVRWQSDGLPSCGPHALLSMEAILTAHQVYVQSQENMWQAQYVLLGKEVDRIMFVKRDNYSGSTKAESENKVLAAEPRVREMRNSYLMAQAMSTLMSGMGSRFAQLEDGIKRTISLVVDEYTRQRIQAKY